MTKILEKTTLHASGFSLTDITHALLKHTGYDSQSVPSQRIQPYAFVGTGYELRGDKKAIATRAGEIVMPSTGIPGAPRAAKITGSCGDYILERYTAFPSGRDLASFNPQEYQDPSKLIALLQKWGFW